MEIQPVSDASTAPTPSVLTSADTPSAPTASGLSTADLSLSQLELAVAKLKRNTFFSPLSKKELKKEKAKFELGLFEEQEINSYKPTPAFFNASSSSSSEEDELASLPLPRPPTPLPPTLSGPAITIPSKLSNASPHDGSRTSMPPLDSPSPPSLASTPPSPLPGLVSLKPSPPPDYSISDDESKPTSLPADNPVKTFSSSAFIQLKKPKAKQGQSNCQNHDKKDNTQTIYEKKTIFRHICSPTACVSTRETTTIEETHFHHQT